MCFAMFLQVLACQNGHQTPKKHANMLGFLQVSLTITKKLLVSHLGLWLYLAFRIKLQSCIK